MVTRNIIEIDEEKCDGCGNCVLACAEGAIEVRDGKAKIVKESYCDGLGACIGECPQGALSIVSKEAEAFDHAAVEAHLARFKKRRPEQPEAAPEMSCPSSRVVHFQQQSPAALLRNWPIQLHLLPVTASFYHGADLLIAADCLPFAMGHFHQGLLGDRILAVGCPKLDQVEIYVEKLAKIFANNEIRSVTVGYMEIPCCGRLRQLVRQALEASGKTIPLSSVKVSLEGVVVEEEHCIETRAGEQS